ncbi:PA14 domain protein [Methanocella conradii HZ254]|uniref:PA14 domain protein n=1 Tax=Methanocella conradii (strain DSM 24694 / JCM 17849 / CGMCC 1.5162 / HZ254) TaxID=1041930 RepID=H8I9C2_METCZ|nr:PA14 domain-containing protein [Methanocella conradii]AFC99540.1 PA14 domain protein [Methanocella conradii HZ254]
MDDSGVADAFYTVLSIGIVLVAAIAISGAVLSMTARQGEEASVAVISDGGMKKGIYAFYYAVDAASSDYNSGNPDDIVFQRLAAEKVEGCIAFNSSTAPPGAPVANGAVLWSGYLYVPSEGEYTLELRSEGQAWLWADGKVASPSNGQSKLFTLKLTGGYHPVKAKYFYRDLGTASCSLWWYQGGLRVPVTALYR